MKWLPWLLALVLLPFPALADIGNVTQSGTITSSGTTPPMLLNGQNSCAVTLSGSFVATVTFQGNPGAFTLTGVGTGSATAPGTSSGGIAAPGASALTSIQLSTVYTSGTINYTIVCTAAVAAGGSSTFTGPALPITLGTSGVGTTPAIKIGAIANGSGTFTNIGTTPTAACSGQAASNIDFYITSSYLPSTWICFDGPTQATYFPTSGGVQVGAAGTPGSQGLGATARYRG